MVHWFCGLCDILCLAFEHGHAARGIDALSHQQSWLAFGGTVFNFTRTDECLAANDSAGSKCFGP